MDKKIETFVAGANLARRPWKERVNLQMSLRTGLGQGQDLEEYAFSETDVSSMDAPYDGVANQ